MAKRIAYSCLLLATACFTSPAFAIVFNPDFEALVAAQGDDPQRFAIAYPLHADAASAGAWSDEGDNRVWRYRISVPTALGLGVHAAFVQVPHGAQLSVKDAKGRVQQFGVEGEEAWSPLVSGESLTLELRVPAAVADRAAFVIDQLQIVYRDWRNGSEHPAYAKLYGKAGSCTLNYACERNAANAGPGRATVAVLVQNQKLCTGTLLANTSGTLRPLLLTARHCQVSGDTGSGIRVYYQAETSCGAPLGAAVRDGIEVPGATHIASRGDAWLLEVTAPPSSAKAWWAGWDATDATPSSTVYEVHHQDGLDKQYAESAGAPYQQDYMLTGGTDLLPGWTWTVGRGDSGPGASGSGLFAGRRLIGLLSGGVGACGSTETNSSMRLADVFNSGAFRQALDPAGTGLRQIDGRDASSVLVNLSASSANILLGTMLTLTWSAQNATSCVASGAWSGSKPTSGSQSNVLNLLGLLTYRLHCTNASGQAGDGVATVNGYDSSAPPPAPASGSVGSGGGGGACGWLFLLPLLGATMLRRTLRRWARLHWAKPGGAHGWKRSDCW